MTGKRFHAGAALALVLGLAACGSPETAPHEEHTAEAGITNRIPLPPEIVANLGVTFAEARTGAIETRLVLPGRLDVPPGRRHTVRAPVAGHVTFRHAHWDEVDAREVVAEIVSDGLGALLDQLDDLHAASHERALELKEEVVEAAGLVRLAAAAEAQQEAAVRHVERAEAQASRVQGLLALARERLSEIEKLAAQDGLARKDLLAARRELVETEALAADALRAAETARVEVPRREAEAELARVRATTAEEHLHVRRWRLDAAARAYRRKIDVLANLTGRSAASLEKEENGAPAWARLETLPLVAPSRGIIASLAVANGGYVAEGDELLEIVDVSELWFEGSVPETEAGRIPHEATVRIRPLDGRSEAIESRIRGPHVLADATARSVVFTAVVPNPEHQIAAGTSALADVLVHESPNTEVLVPLDCVVQDGLEHLVFVRDPANANQVIRTPVALGKRNREEVEVLSGVMAGDQLVRDGAHELREVGSGASTANGHFHSDGTFHVGGH